MNRCSVAVSQSMQHDPELSLRMASEAPILLGKVMGSVELNRCAAVLCSDKANCNVVSSSDLLCNIMSGLTY